MKPGLANAMLLLLLPLSRQSQAKIDRQTEEQKIGAFRSLSFVVCLARSPFHIIHPSLFHPFRTLSPRSRCSTRHKTRQTSPTRRPRKRSSIRGCDDGGHGFHAQLRPAVAAQTVLGPRRQRRRRGPRRRRRDGARRVSRGTQRGPQRRRRRRR